MKIYNYWVPEKQILRAGDDAGLQQWLADYEWESRSYCVCKFIEQVGARYSENELIHIHDDITGTSFRQPLA